MDFLTKVRSLSDGKKKLIFWTVTLSVALFLIWFYVYNTKKRFESFNTDDIKNGFQIQKLKDNIKNNEIK